MAHPVLQKKTGDKALRLLHFWTPAPADRIQAQREFRLHESRGLDQFLHLRRVRRREVEIEGVEELMLSVIPKERFQQLRNLFFRTLLLVHAPAP